MLNNAIQALIDRHPVLRTAFALTGFRQPLQLVHAYVEVPLGFTDLGALTDVEQDSAIDAWIETEKRQPFDWNTPPLLRFHIHRRSSDTFNLSLSFHHSILDGWSVASLMTAVLQQYLTLLGQGDRAFEPSSDLTFRDFVAMEKQALESEDCHQYWLQTLNDAHMTRLPRWSSVSAGEAEPQGILTVDVLPQVSEGLKGLAQQAGVPLKSVLLAAHLRVLSVLGNHADVLTGLVSNGRPEENDGERLLGLFLNTMPFRLQLSGGTWLELVQQTFRAEQEALPFRRYPLAEVQRLLDRQSLFETTFNFVHFHVYQTLEESEGLQVLDKKFFEQTNFTLGASFNLDLCSSQIHLHLKYDASQFCREQVEAIGEYYNRTLTAMARQPSGRYEEHSLLSTSEQQKLLMEWNETQVAYSQNSCIHQLFEAQVEQTPEAEAVVFENQKLTYRELNARANQLAHHLQSLGVGPEVLVGLCMERSVEMVVGLLGILKAGGAYVPLDPTYPAERLALMLSDSQVPVLLTTQTLGIGLTENNTHIVCLDTDWDDIATLSEGNPVSGVEPGNLAYVIYTSGSTGKPKGVMIEHGSVLNLLKGLHHAIYHTEQESQLRISLNGSLSFDTSVKQFIQLLHGHTLEIVPETIRFDGEALLSYLQSHRIDVFDCTPSQLDLLIAAGLLEQEGAFPQYVLVGGEPIDQATWQVLVHAEGTHFYNVYGPTECTVDTTVCSLRLASDTPVIGRPIFNTQVYILDRHCQQVPVGVPGELYIGGAGLARGYLNGPELTEQKFLANPFSDQPGARLYKTGDLGRYRPDGNIEFLGRIDDQVKIRGFRIELGEVETVLASHSGVQTTAVITQVDQQGDTRLIAYILPWQEPPSSRQLREFLRDRLPDYMVPSIFVSLETFPLMPNGKVDRRALPAPDLSSLSRDHNFVPPRNAVELRLAQIWSEVLNIYPVGVQQSFFELGGHSLLAVRLMAQIQKQFGNTLSLSQLLHAETIEQLAHLIRSSTAPCAWSPLVEIQPGYSKRPFFCVHPVGGNVLCYADLARHLGPDQPFYGLQALGLNGENAPLTHIEEMAAHYVEVLRAKQPEGPYQIGGWSLGGVIAFEMAQQLHSAGDEVSLLALIDSYAPRLFKGSQEIDTAMFVSSLVRDLSNLYGKALPISVDELLQLELDQQLSYILNRAKQAQIFPSDVELQQMHQLLSVFSSNIRALHGYQPQSYPGRITLFSASEQALAVAQDLAHGWGDLAADGITTHRIQGDHYAIVRNPQVQVLAQQLRNYLHL